MPSEEIGSGDKTPDNEEIIRVLGIHLVASHFSGSLRLNRLVGSDRRTSHEFGRNARLRLPDSDG